MDAAINSNTSVVEYMNMPVLRFKETWQAIRAVNERKARAMKEKRGGIPRARKRRR